MRGTIHRQWLILTMLPRPPRTIDTAAIEVRLRDRGFEVHRRTIQRDLLDLAAVFPIVSDERAKPYGWRWSEDAEIVPVPSPSSAASSIEVVLRVRRALVGAVLARLAARGAKVVDDATAEDAVTVVAALDDTGSTRRVLLGSGADVAVVSPPALRREIVANARRVLASYEP